MAFSNIDCSHKYLSWVGIPRLSEYVHYENSHDFKFVLTLLYSLIFPGFPWLSETHPLDVLEKALKKEHSIFKQKPEM